jgi:hypothetical protein
MTRRHAVLSPGLGLLVSALLSFSLVTSALAGQKQPHPPAVAPPRPARAQPAPKSSAPGRAPAQGNRQKLENQPGEQALDRLSRMTPEQREKWLSSLPPARRQRIEQSLREFQKMPPAQQNRLRSQQELLNSLPQQRQNQVRRSVQQFVNMPEERKAVVKQEMQRMAPMSDEERRAHMNSEEFRNRYSANEQQMMGNLMEVQPQQ